MVKFVDRVLKRFQDFRDRVRNFFMIHNIVRFIVIGNGLNYHKKLRIPRKNGYTNRSIKINKKKYTIDPTRLFYIPRNIILRIKDRFNRNRRNFIIVFYEGKDEAVRLPSPSKVPSNILDLAERSNILRNALREMFSTGISRRFIIFFVVLIAIVIILYTLYQDGRLYLPDWM